MECYFEQADAPREGCECRNCARAREEALDPELIKLINEERLCIGRPYSVPRPWVGVIYNAVTIFRLGRVTQAEMNMLIIKGLIEQNQKLFDLVAGQPRPSVILAESK